MCVLVNKHSVNVFEMITVFQPHHLKFQWVFISNFKQSDFSLQVFISENSLPTTPLCRLRPHTKHDSVS